MADILALLRFVQMMQNPLCSPMTLTVAFSGSRDAYVICDQANVRHSDKDVIVAVIGRSGLARVALGLTYPEPKLQPVVGLHNKLITVLGVNCAVYR